MVVGEFDDDVGVGLGRGDVIDEVDPVDRIPRRFGEGALVGHVEVGEAGVERIGIVAGFGAEPHEPIDEPFPDRRLVDS